MALGSKDIIQDLALVEARKAGVVMQGEEEELMKLVSTVAGRLCDEVLPLSREFHSNRLQYSRGAETEDERNQRWAERGKLLAEIDERLRSIGILSPREAQLAEGQLALAVWNGSFSGKSGKDVSPARIDLIRAGKKRARGDLVARDAVRLGDVSFRGEFQLPSEGDSPTCYIYSSSGVLVPFAPASAEEK